MKGAIFVKIAIDLLAIRIDGGSLDEFPLASLVVSNVSFDTLLYLSLALDIFAVVFSLH